MSEAGQILEETTPPTGTDAWAGFDWAATPAGPMAEWPQFLKTAYDIILPSPCPLVILWGPEGILLYNEGYAAIAGQRHPEILGQRVLDAWPDAIDLNQRVLDTCLAGQALSLREEHVVVTRNGFPEDVWLDMDYSPLPGQDGGIGGAFAVLNEVTDRVLADRRRTLAENQLALAIEGADIATWDYDLKNGLYFFSDRVRALFGVPPGVNVTRGVLRSRIHPDDRELHEAAYVEGLKPASGGRYDLELRVADEPGRPYRWLASFGRAYFDGSGRAVRFAGSVIDITQRKNAERRQACLVELGDRLRAADSTAEIALIAAEIAGRTLSCTRAGYAMIERQTAFVEADWTNGDALTLSGPRLFGTLGDPFCDPLRAGRQVVIEDVVTHPYTKHDPAPFLAIKIRALVNIPLLKDVQIAAIFYVHQDNVRQWDAGEVELIRDIADRTWEAFGRARSAQRLLKLNETLEHEVALRTAQRDRMWRLSSDVMLVVDFDGVIESVNPAWKSLFGWAEKDLIGRPLFELVHPEDVPLAEETLSQITGTLMPVKIESRHRNLDGSYRWVSWRAVPDEKSIHAVGRDITAEREQAEALLAAEAALRQAQKMEAVGQLTGGIAHDFNNLLQGITGSLELLEKRLNEGRYADVARFTTAAKASAGRAMALTHRLLAFSRRQPLDPKPVQANPLVASMDDLLRRTLGEGIELVFRLEPSLWLTLCDPNQLESALLNLAINARDAMPDGGTLTIETSNEMLGAADVAGQQSLKPGQYICLSVADTGTGMPADVIEQAFDPFFTTKPLGQGTGLGLSMVYGFIRQSEGDARIYSEVGVGTTIKLNLPGLIGGLPEAEALSESEVGLPAARHATILVVEDDDIVRGLVLEVLDDLGLSSITASNGPAGLEILQSRQQVDLLITDIGLPGLNGRQIADAARLLRPSLKVLFMTGYAETAATASGFLEPGMEIITKPFPIAALAERVRRLIEIS